MFNNPGVKPRGFIGFKKMKYKNLKDKQQAEKLLRKKGYVREVTVLFNEAIESVALAQVGVSLLPGVFSLSKYPTLKKRIDKIMMSLFKNQNILLVKSIGTEWDISNKNLDNVFQGKYSRKPGQSKLLELRNDQALQTFTDRKIKGMNLSDRVWRNTQMYRNEIESHLADTIANGRGAKEAARFLTDKLVNPGGGFANVQTKAGEIKVAAPTKIKGGTGQGVYNSAYKNALRVQVTETNMSYLTAEMERYKASPFVIGYEVILSNRHPTYDICDELKGKYPKDFKFIGWHPFCLCHSIAIMLNQSEFDQMERDKFNDVDISKKSYSDNEVKGTPPQVKKWYAENEERSKNWKSKPYFMADNAKFFK